MLIADETEEFRNELARSLCGTYQIYTTGEGKEALALSRSHSPDILVLDLMLPGLDGISLLQQLGDTGCHPAVLATTRFVSGYVLDAVQGLGVAYLMRKPCDVKAIIMRIADLAEQAQTPQRTQPDSKAAVSNLLCSLGVPSKLRGYSYLREAVLLMAQDSAQSITKELYPAVAARCGVDARRVERCARTAIQAAWIKRDEKLWRLYFPPDADGCIPRPTNAAFISRLADAINMEHTGAVRI